MKRLDWNPISRRGVYAGIRRAACFGVLLAALAHTAAAQDLLVLRGGGQRSGALLSCIGDRCVLGGESVPRSEIAWIGLGVGGSPPRAAKGGSTDELYETGGTVRRGAFEGLSLGIVRFAGDSIERRAVRWIRIAGADSDADIGRVPIERDLLVGRDGAIRQGDLQGCVAGACTMGNQTSPRWELAWIGVGVDPEGTPPPLPADPGVDAVQLADGALHPASLVGINATSVVTQRGSHPRSAVDWIYLAPPARGPESTTGQGQPLTTAAGHYFDSDREDA